jgi:hypothetical protein
MRLLERRQTYFHANRECPIFDELRGPVRKTFGGSGVLKDALKALETRIEIAFIFGSITTGSEASASDVDLMAVENVSFMDVVSAISGAQRELGREVNPSVYSAGEFCRKLAEGRQFVTRVMAGPRIFLIGNAQQLKGIARRSPRRR